MGIESQYLGEINIPEEHRAEYAQQALKLLRAGGMVTVEPVQLYGHKLYLLSSPELDEEDGKAVGHYNYLDENSGERWCLNAKDGWFGCGKIIGSCYYSTIAAVHILTTLWSASYAATLINGCLVREKTYIRWINYVLGTQYTNQRATQLWEIASLLQLDDDYWAHLTRISAIYWRTIRQSARTEIRRCRVWLPTILTSCAASSRPSQMKIGRS